MIRLDILLENLRWSDWVSFKYYY